MKRRKNRVTNTRGQFAGRIETSDLEQQLADFLLSFNFHIDSVSLRDFELPTLLFNRGVQEKHVVIIPHSILEAVYEKLVNLGLTTRLGKHPRLNSRQIKEKLEAQKKAERN